MLKIDYHRYAWQGPYVPACGKKEGGNFLRVSALLCFSYAYIIQKKTGLVKCELRRHFISSFYLKIGDDIPQKNVCFG